MKNIRWLYSGIFFICLAAISSCVTPPEFPVEPKIEFVRVEQNPIIETTQLGSNKVNRLILVIKFEDGDGDLGLTDTDAKQPPYLGTKEDNYIIDIFIKKNGRFELLQLPILYADPARTIPIRNPDGSLKRARYDGRFFPLSPDGRIGPLEGELKYDGLVLRENNPEIDLKRGDILKFRVKILDRKLNESNSVDSEEISLLFP